MNRAHVMGLVTLAGLLPLPELAAQARPVGRNAALALEFAPLRFEAPEVRTERVSPGVTVLFLEDHSLPLVSVYARFKGGYALFPRERYATATAMPGLLRYGGTRDASPDSIDKMLESLAVQVSFGSGGRSVSSSFNALTSTLDEGLELWGQMLKFPRFDPAQIEVWRGRELESVRRRLDDPRRLAFSEFNRIMYGDHPVGWEMTPADLDPDRMRPDRFRRVHAEIVCPENLVLGVAGDITWDEARARLEALLADWPACPGALPEPPLPRVRTEPAVFLIPRALDQSTIVMAQATSVHLAAEPEYFSSRIGNTILGAGGFSSRLMARVRTEEGLAYGASSLWTAPRTADGLLGAITQTGTETTVDAVDAMLDVMDQVRRSEPTDDELTLAVDRAVNGFVFNFQTAGQIVARQMLYQAQDLPPDWLDLYLEGIQRVSATDVRDVFARHLRPEDMTILVLGDPELAPALARFGEVRLWNVEAVLPGSGSDVDRRDSEALQRVGGLLESGVLQKTGQGVGPGEFSDRRR